MDGVETPQLVHREAPQLVHRRQDFSSPVPRVQPPRERGQGLFQRRAHLGREFGHIACEEPPGPERVFGAPHGVVRLPIDGRELSCGIIAGVRELRSREKPRFRAGMERGPAMDRMGVPHRPELFVNLRIEPLPRRPRPGATGPPSRQVDAPRRGASF